MTLVHQVMVNGAQLTESWRDRRAHPIKCFLWDIDLLLLLLISREAEAAQYLAE